MAPDGVTSPLLAVLIQELIQMQAPMKYIIILFATFYKYIPPAITSEHDMWLGIKNFKLANRVHFNVYTYLIDNLPPKILVPLLQCVVKDAASEYFSLRFKEMGLKMYQPMLARKIETQTLNTQCNICEEDNKCSKKRIKKKRSHKNIYIKIVNVIKKE